MLILVLVAVLGPTVWSVTCVIVVLGWTQFARLIYANVLSVSEKEYVESASAIGTSNFKIVTKYVLPNSFAPILIAITFQMASAILSESSLSFLGMGVQPPGASWGNMLYDAQSITVLSQKLWIWLPPGLALLITVLSINFLGDGIRDALDPKIKMCIRDSIGVVRNEGFIPWDDDVDIYMPRDDWNKLVEISGSVLPEHRALQCVDVDRSYTNTFPRYVACLLYTSRCV